MELRTLLEVTTPLQFKIVDLVIFIKNFVTESSGALSQQLYLNVGNFTIRGSEFVTLLISVEQWT